MSTGKRLAKRSIIGTRVCALGPDQLWHSGIIQAVKTPANSRDNNNCINLTPDTKYSVRFDIRKDGLGEYGYGVHGPHGGGQPRRIIKEFREFELIGPGFQSVLNFVLKPGQRVFLTYNGRESAAEVISHDIAKDEVIVRIPANGQEASIELKKRLEEVRLLESRRSARLADQDTDFARLADMAGDRRRASHSIDVPLTLAQHGSRKRRPSYSQDSNDLFQNLPPNGDDPMDACNAALVLMSLSCSPHSPHWPNTIHNNTTAVNNIINATTANTRLGSSPGGSSSASSWCSGSSSPPLSDESGSMAVAGGGSANVGQITSSAAASAAAAAAVSTLICSSNNRARTTSLSTSDEGIVMDYNEETPRKRRANGPIFQCTWKGCSALYSTVNQIEAHVRNAHLGPKKPSTVDDDTLSDNSDHEEEFYYTEIDDDEDSPSPPSPPTLSHRDMARPPHEDPEYQRQIVGNIRQGLLSLSSQMQTVKPPLPISVGPINIPTSPLAHHNYTWAHQSPMSPQKHVRLSPRPSTSYAPYPSPTYTSAIASAQHNINVVLGTSPNLHAGQQQQQQLNHQHQHPLHQHQHHQQSINGGGPLNLSHSAPQQQTLTSQHQLQHQQQQQQQQSQPQPNRSPLSPNRRTRGENKKCRKVYGMEHKDLWCTQCKWKKACSRFGD